MKKLVLGAAIALAATSAMAGSIADPIIGQDIIIEQAPTSSINPHILPPLFWAIMVGSALILG